MPRRRTVAALVVLALAGFLIWLLNARSPPSEPEAQQAAAARAKAASHSGSSALRSGVPHDLLGGAGVPPVSTAAQPTSVRTELPRFEADHYKDGLRSLTLPHPAADIVDKRPNPGPRAKQELEAINYGIDSLDEDVASCLSEWGQAAGLDGGRVLIGFAVSDKGLQRSWVQSDVEIPFGPRSCLASAVYGIDWSHIVEEPGEITHWYSLSPQ